nr:reverse transcriptase domain-containing protein [Tanacetum cinerariifolium]
MCEFDIILGMDWLTEHHATIDCRSYRVIFGDIHAPEFVYHGSLPGKSMHIISAFCWHRRGACEELLVGSSQSSHRSHGHHNDRHGLDRRGGSDNHHSSSNNYPGSNNRNSGYGRNQRNRGHQSNRSANFGSQQSRGPSEGYSYPVCTTCGRRHPGVCRRAAGTCFKCGQAGHLHKDCKKNTIAVTPICI